MQFKLAPILPWTPTASFTGTTEYTIDPYNGLIRKHVDKWDSIQDNENLSLEGLRYTLSSFAQVRIALSCQATLCSRNGLFCIETSSNVPHLPCPLACCCHKVQMLRIF